MFCSQIFISKDLYLFIDDKKWFDIINICKLIILLKTIYIEIIKEFKSLDFRINVLLSKKSRMTQLNVKFKNINKDTNVLAFKNCDLDQKFTFDIIISLDFLLFEYFNYQFDLYERLLRLIVHGILHCLGFNDNNKYNDYLMQIKEDDCLKKIYNLI